MPHPVPPPEPPAIINNLPPEDVTPPIESSTWKPISNRTHSAVALASPTQPETFAPEPSPLTAAKSAALLGPPISIGHPSLGLKGQGSGVDTTSQVVKTPNLSSLQSGRKVSAENKALTLQRPSDSTLVDRQVQVSQLPSVDPQPPEIPDSPTSPNQEPPEVEATPEPEGELETPLPPRSETPWPEEEVAPAPASTLPSPPASQPQTQPPSGQQTPGTATETLTGSGGLLELTSDRQEYDVDRKVVTAEGDALLRFQGAVIDADRLQVNLPNRIVVAEGNVAYRRGQQVVRGNRLEYSIVQDSGVILNASGDLYIPSAGADFSDPLPTDVNATTFASRPLTDRIAAQQPLQQIANAGGYGIVFGSSRSIPGQPGFSQGGNVNRIRYQAERVELQGGEAFATNVRLTNDPFSPPELELRADTARFRRISPLVDEITTTRSRIVFDQGLSVPTFQNRRVIDRREQEPGLFTFGYDDDDRGGLFIQRSFTPISTPRFRLRLTPQYYLQKAIEEGSFLSPSVFGLRANADATLSPRTTVSGKAVFTTLGDSDDDNPLTPVDADDELRASLRLRQLIGDLRWPHTLTLETSYRDRLFNGSLGFQTVRSSIGAVLTSPVIPIGRTGINLSYQAGIQSINSDTDRLDLLDPIRLNNRVNLTRYQASASLNRGFLLWQGKPLPATATEGLRYTPAPVVPYVGAYAGVTGVFSGYSNGDSQESLSGTIGVSGQLGHFSRPFFDYTGFNIAYTQVVRGGTSPFLFDRAVDTSVLSAGITQQIYGPFRIGVQTSLSLDNNRAISTDYFLEYSRRTYNIVLRYNPVLEIGSLSFRLNDFNWSGSPEPFAGTDIRPVIQGVTR